MRILVTGGLGFVGRHLVARLLKAGDQVTVVDSRAFDANNHFLPDKDEIAGARVLIRDIIDLDVFTDVLRADDFDQIYHLACPASPPRYQINPIHTMLTSVIGTQNVLSFAACAGCRVLFTSTSEIYGDPKEHPQVETYCGNVSTTGPRACYDEGKRAAETLCADYRRSTGLDTRIVRIFNTYGPGLDPDDGRVVSNFLNQAIAGNPLTVYGDGTQTRSFLFVSDLVDGLTLAMNVCQSAGPINLGNPQEITMLELAKAVLSATSSKSVLTHCDLPIDDPVRRCPDITRANNLLDWRPTVDLSAGLLATAKYFKSIVPVVA